MGVALICGSLLNVTLSVVLIRYYGLAGVALATVIASVVIDLIAMPLLVQQILGLSAVMLLRRAGLRPLAAGLLQAVWLVCIRLTGRPEHWLQLISRGMLAGLGSAIIVLGIGLASEERQRFLVQPLRRVWQSATMPVEVPGS